MSMHGDVRINGQVIGRWYARRQQREVGDTNTYECWVRLNGQYQEFEITHRYRDGSAVLLTKMLMKFHARCQGGDAWPEPRTPNLSGSTQGSATAPSVDGSGGYSPGTTV